MKVRKPGKLADRIVQRWNAGSEGVDACFLYRIIKANLAKKNRQLILNANLLLIWEMQQYPDYNGISLIHFGDAAIEKSP